jgi:predicted metal-dependent phosphoesterase TrpH
MQLKTNLHFHTADDPQDFVPYTTAQGIDHAAHLGFGALALTCHQRAVWTPEYAAYAAARGILLIPGIEINIRTDDKRVMGDEHTPAYGGHRDARRGRHLIILNCTPEAERVRTFADLRDYRARHPECFVLAPHPFSYGNFSLKKFLERHITLIDAIEYTWFHSQRFDRNKKSAAVAARHGLPVIVTSDAHTFRNMDTDYALVDSAEKTIPALFDAIRNDKITNITRRKKPIREMALPAAALVGRNFLYRRGWKKPVRGSAV